MKAMLPVIASNGVGRIAQHVKKGERKKERTVIPAKLV
jgi:hypothetical protein